MNIRLFFDRSVVVSDSSEKVPLQGEFQLAGMGGGRKRAVDVKAVEGRASRIPAFCEPIMTLMLVVIGEVIPWLLPSLRTTVISPTHPH